MDKGFQFHLLRDVFPDLADFIYSKLPRHHQPFHALGMPELSRHVIRHIGLGRKMQFRLRHSFFYQSDHARIRHDERINRNMADFRKVSTKRFDVFVVREDVHSHMAADTFAVSVRYTFLDFLNRKVSGSRPKAEHFSTEVDRICTVVYCDFQFFQISRRSK